MSSIEEIKESKVINSDDAIYLLDRQIADKGFNYRYKDEFAVCSNFGLDGTTGQCIVGKSMQDLGLTYDEVGNGSAEGTVNMLRHSGWTVSVGAELVFTAAQAMQDSGTVWGAARDAANRVVRIHDATL